MWNESFGWFLILAGVLMGSYMGIKFQREDWLGGYFSLPRRMVRLAHVALVALGMLNILFARSLESLKLSPTLETVASWTLMTAAFLMPASCICISLGSRRFEMFAAPILCLVTALILTIGGLLQ